jgi:YggT family protein
LLARSPLTHPSRVPTFLIWFAYAIHLLGYALFIIAVVLAVVALIDWLVRTRRINPFNPIARFFRRAIDPLIAPMERRVVRAGQMPHAAPWWMLVAVVVGGIVALSLLRFLLGELTGAYANFTQGPRGILVLLFRYTFAFLKLAIIVRVISSWLRISPYSRWVRWSFSFTEPIFRPLRNIVPPLGMIDITPIVAWFLLWLLETFVMYALYA